MASVGVLGDRSSMRTSVSSLVRLLQVVADRGETDKTLISHSKRLVVSSFHRFPGVGSSLIFRVTAGLQLELPASTPGKR
jgi:hypothetical protein